MTQLVPYYPFHHSDFLPEVPPRSTALTFHSGRCFLLNAGIKASLFIRAAGNITLHRSKRDDICVELDSNFNKYRAFTTDNAMFLTGSLNLDHDLARTRIRIHVPPTLQTLGLVLPKTGSFFDSEVAPLFSYVDVNSLSIVRLSTNNLFLHATRKPLTEISLVPLRSHDNSAGQAGNVAIFATGGSHILNGTYHDGTIVLSGSASVSNEASCLGLTRCAVTRQRGRKHFERIRSTRNMSYELLENEAALSQEHVRRSYNAMRKKLGLD
jgi:hypothetical protein